MVSVEFREATLISSAIEMEDAFEAEGMDGLILKGAPLVLPPPQQRVVQVGKRDEFDFLAEHQAKQALHAFTMKLEAEAKKGIQGLAKSLVRHVSVAQTWQEFLMVFSSVPYT